VWLSFIRDSCNVKVITEGIGPKRYPRDGISIGLPYHIKAVSPKVVGRWNTINGIQLDGRTNM